jgi:hypothetical protein
MLVLIPVNVICYIKISGRQNNGVFRYEYLFAHHIQKYLFKGQVDKRQVVASHPLAVNLQG